MKRWLLPLLLLLLLLLPLGLTACGPAETAVGVTSCEFLSERDGHEIWRMTDADGAVNEITVKARSVSAPTLGVSSCEKSATEGLTDTYTVTFSDGSLATFTVTNGAAGPAGAPGEVGPAPTVTSCERIASTAEGDTWRISFGESGTAEFTVPRPTGGAPADGWQDVVDKVEILFGALEIRRLPSLTEGNRTVTDGGAATRSEAISSTFSGWAFLMTKEAMFGDADTVYGIKLNKFNLEEGKQETVPLEIRFLDISSATSFLDATVYKTYTVEVTPVGIADYFLEVEIAAEDLSALGDEFMIGIETLGSTRVGMKASSNAGYTVESELLDDYEVISERNYYKFSGYYTHNDSGKHSSARSTSIARPDVFFSTAYEEEYSFTGSIGGGATEDDTKEDASVEGLLRLPEQYDLVVGDTFELFYKGITCCADESVYDYELAFTSGKNLGKGYSRKYIWTPTAEDIGVHTLTVTVRSNEGAVLDTGKVKLNVVAPPTSPAEERVVLIIGDSLTSGGEWPLELFRRLTGTGGTPVGLGLTNISFIGSKEKDGVKYEGYGGWNFGSYTTANKRNDFMILTGNFSDKSEDVDQHSVYQDAKGTKWKIEWVTDTEMKIIAASASGALPSTAGGTLTYVSGGMNHGDIVYTAARQADANPFWDAEAGKNDFVAYAERYGKDRIDEVILFMGWNHYRDTPDTFAVKARVLIDAILADFPECHISLVGLQIPSRDGFANSYGITWPWFPMLTKVFAFEDAYRAIAKEEAYAGRLSVVSVAGQYDADYNEIKATIPVNNRNPATETVGSNGVHPSKYGYLQIADAIYRHMCTRLQ